jgi:hypothetical protein
METVGILTCAPPVEHAFDLGKAGKMWKHGGGGSEYREIFGEADPAENRLYTVK